MVIRDQEGRDTEISRGRMFREQQVGSEGRVKEGLARGVDTCRQNMEAF